MIRGLFLLSLATALSGCWTFRTLNEAVEDTDVASDTGAPDTNEPIGDMFATDMTLVDGDADDVAIADGGSADLADMSVVQLEFERISMCSPPASHDSPFARQEALQGLFAPAIGFARLDDAVDGFGAEVIYANDGIAQRSHVSFVGSSITIEPGVPLPAGPGIAQVAGGTSDQPGQFVWGAATEGGCTTNASGQTAFWWGGEGDMALNWISDCNTPPDLYAMEVGGGYDPFTQSTFVGRRLVWQSTEGLVVSVGGTFGLSAASSSPFPALLAAPAAHTLSTHGELVLLSGSDGLLHAWNVTRDDRATAPRPTDLIDGGRGSIDVVSLDPQRYAVARVEGDRIVLELFEGLADDNHFGRVGHWTSIDGLSNPANVELATFRGGFALWFEETDRPNILNPSNSSAWSVYVFEVVGERLTMYDCVYQFAYGPDVIYRDNDLIAHRDGTDVFVVGAVNFDLAAEHFINVEGPLFRGLLPP